MRRYQGFEVDDYVFTLDALPLKSSRFCNIVVDILVVTIQNGVWIMDRGVFETTSDQNGGA